MRLIQHDWCFNRRGVLGHRHNRRKDDVKTPTEGGQLQAKEREASEKAKPAATGSQTSSIRNCEKINFSC